MANSRICAIEGCDKAVKARGLCNAHHRRLLRHGDPLGGGTAQGEPLRFLNENALAFKGAECLIWPYATLPNGYGHLWINGAGVLASRYVCEKCNGPAPSPSHEAAHNCGNGHLACINPLHLEWKTHVENEADKLIHGTHHRGERCPTAKLTEGEVREILALKGKMLGREVGELYGVTRWTVFDIWKRRIWSWLDAEQAAPL